MKKLGSVEKIDEFILAIASGADINGTWKGRPLVEHYFIESLRHSCVYPVGHPRYGTDMDMLKLQAIIKAGADVTPLFWEQLEYGYQNYGNLVRVIIRRLDLLNVVLSSRQAKEFVEENSEYQRDLLQLYETLQSITKSITQVLGSE